MRIYRGEVHRSTSWRQRLDATTNWAVLTTAALLSFTFASQEQHTHIILLLTNLIILAYLAIEARRYRYFEVYRARVRMLEAIELASALGQPVVLCRVYLFAAFLMTWRRDYECALDYTEKVLDISGEYELRHWLRAARILRARALAATTGDDAIIAEMSCMTSAWGTRSWSGEFYTYLAEVLARK